MAKAKLNKYTNLARYCETTRVRLDHYQALQLEELCDKYHTNKSAIIRLALNQFIKQYNESTNEN